MIENGMYKSTLMCRFCDKIDNILSFLRMMENLKGSISSCMSHIFTGNFDHFFIYINDILKYGYKNTSYYLEKCHSKALLM